MNNRVFHVFYLLMIITLAVMTGWILVKYDGKSIIEDSFDETRDFSAGWVLEDGSEIDIAKMGSVEELLPGEEFSVYNKVPDDFAEGEYLCFRAKNIFFTIYVDGQLVYDPYVPENIFYTKGPGTKWHYVKLSETQIGKEIEFKVTKVYDSGKASIIDIELGEPARAIMDTIEEKLVAFITCILTIFIGILLIIADIPINISARKNHELLYLGLFSVSVAGWCLVETHLIQYYLGDSRVMQLLSCCALMMIAIPIILYLDAAFGFRKRKAVTAMIGLSFGSFVLAMILHMTRIADVHETLHFSHVVLIMSAIVLFYTIIKNTFVLSKSAGKNIFRVIRGVGLCSLSVATVIDIVRYYVFQSNDTAMFVRIGLLIFIICFGASSLEKTINAVRLGAQTEIVSQLAYRDGLTRIGNRTAFNERLVELEEIKNQVEAIGIVMFDVNDLKFINDNFGHHMGDAMLMASAKLIENAFADLEADCFRIGGDEFAVLLSGDNVDKRCESAIDKFKALMKAHNQNESKEFRISIAHGFAKYDASDREKPLLMVYQQADMLMYENKKSMKQSMQAAADYYSSTGKLKQA
ncbi:MAG: GGDEF domain-containing protein [Lachnospiraceae bacterium]|nr:GGDEF domain-containing protein [Lachnospiraceae bacterium]